MKRKIFFNKEAHAYTDDLGRKYTSMTTIIGKYENKPDPHEMAVGCYKR